MYRLIRTIFLLGVIAALIGGGWAFYIYSTTDVEQLRGIIDYVPPNQTQSRKAGLAHPDNARLVDIPPELIFATFAAEDYDFAIHRGVRPGTIWTCIKGRLFHGAQCGGSSLTQQVVKNLLVGSEQTLYRKAKEMIVALKLERHFTKADIFTLYANIAETGPGMYGYKQAAQLYFGKRLRELTPVESAFIASNLSAPTLRSRWYLEKSEDPKQVDFIKYILFNALIFRTELFSNDHVPAGFLAHDPFGDIAAHYDQIASSWTRYSQDEAMKEDVSEQVDRFVQRHLGVF
ncbi:MAG: biosynthetic peptidoglycan transglycosylase [Rickettsiales bacterium]|nr:biosynthetic peptidoglycan transglycosylase [Rickettsiales bacterium]